MGVVTEEALLLENMYPLPDIVPGCGHPSVLFTRDDVPVIRENLGKNQNKNAYCAFEDWLKKNTDGMLKNTGSMNFDENVITIIEAKAFDYVINGNRKNGEAAVSAMLNVLRTMLFEDVLDVSRQMGQTIFTAAEVYDWCYPLLSDENKEEIINRCVRLAMDMETGWPPSQSSAIVGHVTEAMLLRDLLAFSIAVFDKRPDIYNCVAGRILSEFVPARDYYFVSRSYHQGTNYTPVRYMFDLWAQWIFYKIGKKRIFIDECGYVPYQLLYYTRADGQLIREGDIDGENMGPNQPVFYNNLWASLIASSFYKDAYLKAEVERIDPDYSQFIYVFPSFTPVHFLIMNDPDLEPKPLLELPKTVYFGSPNGLMVARTGWNYKKEAPDALAFMKIGEEWMTNHHHLDAGTFQIYYKGILAYDAGKYDSYGTALDYNFSKETISHNGLLIYDPDEKPYQSVNSGGQRRPGKHADTIDEYKTWDYSTGKVIGVEFGPSQKDPEYSYISGDITKAYTKKVTEVKRSMMFMTLADEAVPAVFFVMDKIRSAKATFKKTFLLHSLQEPEIEGDITVIKRDTDGYNGKLTVTTLYPKNPVIEKIGGLGKQWLVGGVNQAPSLKYNFHNIREDLDYGWGRVEISPSKSNEEDFFLHAMTVSDADETAPLRKAELIETDTHLGARLMNKICLFGKSSEPIKSDFTINLQWEEEFDIAVTGLKEGKWELVQDGGIIKTVNVSKEGGMLYFHGVRGSYEFKLREES